MADVQVATSQHLPIDAAKAGKRTKGIPSFRCSYCDKVFKRSEHCSRHEMSHTNEKPYTCVFCLKSYARRDLVKRHEQTIHADQYAQMLEEKRQAALENGAKSPRSSGKKTSMSQGARRASNATKSNVQLESERSTNTETGKSVSVGAGGPAVTTGSDSQFAAPMLAIGQRDGEMQANSNDSALQHTFEHNVNPLTNPSPMQFSESILAQPNFGRPDEDDPTQSGSNKRIRLSDASMDLANAQDFNSFQLPTPTTFFSEAPNDQLSLMDFGLSAEQLGSDFCLPLASQQQADMPLAAFSAEHNFGLSTGFDDFAFLHPSPEGTSSSCSDSTDGRFDRALLPKILRERSNNPPRVEISDAAYESLREDAIRRAGRDDMTLPLRSRRDLEHLMTGYFDCFHRHVPIIHPPSFKVEATPSPLVLAMCAIGAQYRLDRSKARKLFDVSNQLLRAGDLDSTSDISRLSEARSTQTSKLRPLWVMQARTLLVLLGALSNDTNLLDAELERIGGFIKDYKRRRTELAKYRDRAKQSISYKEWIEIEATKRYLCASFVCSSLLVVVYDLPPGFSITHDLDFDALDEEKLWNAPTEEAWQALRVSTSNASLTIRRVMDDMLSGSLTANDQAPYYVSGFTALVIIHAIGMYSRNLSQFTQFKTAVFSDPTENVQNMLFTAALSSFARCREILNIARPDCSDFVWNEPEGPLLSNCEAMLRVAYTRLFLYEMMPDSLMLFSNSPEENTGLLRKLVSTKQRRGPLITKAMSSMCEGFSVPAKAGYLLVQKTASISWSVEHAIAGWGCVLLLSHWVHWLEKEKSSYPANEAESDLIAQIKISLDGMDFDYDESKSLAAAVLRSWAPLMLDVWVWGITTKIGRILTDLADLYEADLHSTAT